MTESEAAAMVGLLMAHYPTQTANLSEQAIMVYARYFEPFTLVQADLAVRQLVLAEPDFFPSAGKLAAALEEARAYERYPARLSYTLNHMRPLLTGDEPSRQPRALKRTS